MAGSGCPVCDADVAVGMLGNVCIHESGDKKTCESIIERYDTGAVPACETLELLERVVKNPPPNVKEVIATTKEFAQCPL